MDKTSPKKAMKDLTIMLMYLSRFSAGRPLDPSINMTWKAYNFDIVNDLEKDDYIRQGSNRSKSVVLTEEGIRSAQKLLKKYKIKDWE